MLFLVILLGEKCDFRFLRQWQVDELHICSRFWRSSKFFSSTKKLSLERYFRQQPCLRLSHCCIVAAALKEGMVLCSFEKRKLISVSIKQWVFGQCVMFQNRQINWNILKSQFISPCIAQEFDNLWHKRMSKSCLSLFGFQCIANCGKALWLPILTPWFHITNRKVETAL